MEVLGAYHSHRAANVESPESANGPEQPEHWNNCLVSIAYRRKGWNILERAGTTTTACGLQLLPANGHSPEEPEGNTDAKPSFETKD